MPPDHPRGVVELGEATIPSVPGAASLARALVSRWLGSGRHALIREDVRLLVSELVTNSVRHAGQPPGAPVHLRAVAVDGVLRVEVHDEGRGPVRQRDPDAVHGGLGLCLVDRLAERWGVTSEPSTRVWFELALREPGG